MERLKGTVGVGEEEERAGGVMEEPLTTPKAEQPKAESGALSIIMRQ